jgi:sortase A
MSHNVPRQSRFLLIAAILTLTLFSIAACTAEKLPPTPPPPVKIAQPFKIARRVKTTEPTRTLPSVPVNTPTDVAATATLMPPPPSGGLPNAAGWPSAGLPKGAGQPPTRLVIPEMNLDAGIREAVQTTSQQSGQFYEDSLIPYDAVGHIVSTANPGELGNMVISGHHNLIGPNQFGKGLFGGLWDLQVGDAIYVFDRSGRAFAYTVARSYNVKEGGESFAVREQHASEILADTGEPILTLITCWNGAVAPYSGNTYRWIVAAHLVNPIQPELVPVIVRNPTPME